MQYQVDGFVESVRGAVAEEQSGLDKFAFGGFNRSAERAVRGDGSRFLRHDRSDDRVDNGHALAASPVAEFAGPMDAPLRAASTGPTRSSTYFFSVDFNPSTKKTSVMMNKGPITRPMMSSVNAGLMPSYLWPMNWITQPTMNNSAADASTMPVCPPRALIAALSVTAIR